MSRLLDELKRLSNNSKVLRIIFGSSGRDSITVFFHRLSNKIKENE